MVSCLVFTFLSKTLSHVNFLTEPLLPRILYENRQLCLTKPHLWRNLVGSLPQNHSCHPLVWNLVDLSPWASVSKVVCRYSTFLPILSHIECFHCNPKVECDSCVAIDCFQWPLLGRYLRWVLFAPHSMDLCDRCTPEMRSSSPQDRSGDSRQSENAQTHRRSI